jgi:membrane protein DedA with SNARE-associated domain
VPLASITEHLTSVVGDHGLYAVFALMAFDAILPAASELVMVYAGALAAGAFAPHYVTLFGDRVTTPFWAYFAMAMAGTLGYLVGSIGGWAIGIYGGRPYLERHGRWLHLSPEKLARAERWFDRWDELAVLVGRVTPVARSFISIPAGVFRMRLAPYVALTVVGSAAWAFALAGVGWAVGKNWESFHDNFRYADYAIIGGIVLLAALFLFRKRRSSTLARRASEINRATDTPR